MSLGFILCKQILEQYGGNLWLENGEEATGSTFHFVLPTHVALGKELQEDEANRRSEKGPAKNREGEEEDPDRRR